MPKLHFNELPSAMRAEQDALDSIASTPDPYLVEQFERGKMRQMLDERLIEDLCLLIEQGNYLSTACAAVGVSAQTFYGWMGKAKQPGAKPIYHKLQRCVKQAEAHIESIVVQNWFARTKNDWQASRDFLARRFPERWANKEKRELTGKNGGPIAQAHLQVQSQVDLSKLTDEELETLERIARKLAPNELTPSEDDIDLNHLIE